MKKIAVFTSTRAEYGLLFPLLKKLKNDVYFQLDLLVGGSHLLPSFGYTKQQIITDGFFIKTEFPFLETENSSCTESEAMATLTVQIGQYLQKDKPDMILVLGDRYELLPVVSVALVLNIPIAHISGGDVTEGAIDNQVRHAITKMAHVHFPATEIYKNNLMKMGEEEWRICVAGEPGLDEILTMRFLTKKELYDDLKLNIEKETAIITFHPETITNAITPVFVSKLFEEILSNYNFQILVTAANFDNGGSEINKTLVRLSHKNENIVYVESLGQKRYYSMLNYAKIMIGNSSSGLTEAQSFNLPVINVGDRQKGRLANKNVMNLPIDTSKISESIKIALSSDFITSFKNKPNIYGDGQAANRIIPFLKQLNWNNLLTKKSIF